jgi:hypothetical protein
MKIAQVLPAVAGHDELRTYRCDHCDTVLTIPIKPDR